LVIRVKDSAHPDLATKIAALPRLHVSELRAKFASVFGEPTPSHNNVWLVKRIAWRLQAQPSSLLRGVSAIQALLSLYSMYDTLILRVEERPRWKRARPPILPATYLAAFGQCKLDDAVTKAVLAHFDGCDECRRRVAAR
jgi:hypothetical protein